jgi:hypothetical protein
MMFWERPDFVEIKMDSEINSYQPLDGRDPSPLCLTSTFSAKAEENVQEGFRLTVSQ